MANSKKTYGLQNLALSHKARMILGTSGLGAMDDESIVNTAVTLCPNAATVEEAVECLLDESQLINCPEGVRKAVMSVFCRFEHDDQVGLLGQKLRILEAPIYDTYQILANGGDAVSKIELFKNKKDEDQIIGQTNLGNSKFDEGEFYVATGIQILYGEAADYQDCRFGDIRPL